MKVFLKLHWHITHVFFMRMIINRAHTCRRRVGYFLKTRIPVVLFLSMLDWFVSISSIEFISPNFGKIKTKRSVFHKP